MATSLCDVTGCTVSCYVGRVTYCIQFQIYYPIMFAVRYIFTDRISIEGNVVASVCFQSQLLNRVTFDLDLLFVYGS